jgi:hypothetical protein
MCQAPHCGKCRFCDYAPVTVDAAVCPRCCGWAPNPGLVTQFSVGMNLAIYAFLSLICIGLVLVGIFANPAAFFYAVPFAGGFFGIVRTLVRPYGGPQ